MDQLSIYLPGILLAYSIFLVGVASPGPNILAIIGTSMSIDRKSGVSLALGVAMGSLTWGILAASGLSALLAKYASALIFIKIAGGLYLLWLAYKSFKSASSTYDLEVKKLGQEGRSPLRCALSGYTVQMTNPKAALAWIATISLGLQPGSPIWVSAAIVLGIFVLSTVTHTLYAIAFSTSFMVAAYSRARRYIQATLGVFFSVAGLKLLTDRN
ncbi:LysE family translocator [Shimia sagamensis]|uniref:Threonine/homoserine/homoserine lactone efflux protein n=1 Tax=Shimia sagamensis TaxID=1566352 RepID=A0ABY1PM09_9RHOB|nr:LysE family translocator [Shimia sagamensis]SMP36506.1 Threonine/homoserine/homoserine lactone efflux protein [Shimia sagamensis]